MANPSAGEGWNGPVTLFSERTSMKKRRQGGGELIPSGGYKTRAG